MASSSAAAVRFYIEPVRISRALRYTHWNNAAVSGYHGDGPSWASSREQVELMAGIAWGKRLRRVLPGPMLS